MSNPNDQNPYEQNPYEQNPYGQNPYGQGGQPFPQPHPSGTVVLVLGILGIVLCPIAGIVSLVMGNKALKEIDANPMAYNNRQNVNIGRILGIVAIALWALVIIFYVVVFVIVGANGGFNS